MTDHEKLFLKQADSYVKARPTYPASLFKRLASLTKQHERAWDVGTGNGQAAITIAEHYKSVVASDISEPQLSHALQRPNITYYKMSATPSAEELERVVGAEGSVDLVTVASALHWFDLDKFYPIVKHVLRKPGGVFAAWVYWKYRINEKIDKIMDEWIEILTPYRALDLTVEQMAQGFKTIPFPFEPVEPYPEGRIEPELMEMKKQMNLDDFLLLWKSSSVVQTALDQGVDFLNDDRRQAILKAWGSKEDIHTATFFLHVLIGTVSPAHASAS